MIRINPYAHGSSETFYYDFVSKAYWNPVMLSYNSLKYSEFSAIKIAFETDAIKAAIIHRRPCEYVGFTEIRNHTFCPITFNNQSIGPGMAALFAAIFKDKFDSTELKMEHNSIPIFESFDNHYGHYPKYIKKGFSFINNANFIEVNKDRVFDIKYPDNGLCIDLLVYLKYCKEVEEIGVPLREDGERYLNPLFDYSIGWLEVYNKFKKDPDEFEMYVEHDTLLMTYEISEKIIKQAGETSKKVNQTLKSLENSTQSS